MNIFIFYIPLVSLLFFVVCITSLLHRLLAASAAKLDDSSLMHWLTELLSAIIGGLFRSWTSSKSAVSAVDSSLLLLRLASLFFDNESVFDP